MAKDLSVDLNTNTGLLVVDHKNTVINQQDDINWQLVNNAASGQFNTLDAPQPGFQWAPNQNIPSGTFNLPSESNNNKQITMKDNHPGVGGPWSYELAATINGTVHVTGAVSIGGGVNDPTIENR